MRSLSRAHDLRHSYTRRIEKFFNTEGPPRSDLNYLIDPLSRVDLNLLDQFLARQQYFVLHAPRQTGKTAVLLALEAYWNHRGDVRCVYSNIEAAQAARNDVEGGMRGIVDILALDGERALGDRSISDVRGEVQASMHAHQLVNQFLSSWARLDERPLVLLLDEVDALVGDTLLALLRQLRAGYPHRPSRFPSSIVLCGVRDVRDYRLQLASGEVVTGGSAFNIKAASLRLGDFDKTEIRDLYQQHTDATGQAFEDSVFEYVWEQTRGQPWLVNALAREACEASQSDRNRVIELADMTGGRDRLIVRRETHLDQLTDKLKEERVRRVVEPILAATGATNVKPDDIDYACDLGLVRLVEGVPDMANAIYAEVVPRELAWITQATQLTQERPPLAYVQHDGRLDLSRLLGDFQQWMRENFDVWSEAQTYREAAVHLVLSAFLNRVVNGRGSITREYALGRGRVDLAISWPLPDGSRQRFALEVKVIAPQRSAETARRDGLEQLQAYGDRLDATEAHLLIADRRPGRTWDERITHEELSAASAPRPTHIWGC